MFKEVCKIKDLFTEIYTQLKMVAWDIFSNLYDSIVYGLELTPAP
jgi:hypothetical protein